MSLKGTKGYGGGYTGTVMHMFCSRALTTMGHDKGQARLTCLSTPVPGLER